MREKFLTTLLIVAALAVEFHPHIHAQEAANKARQLIAQARAALGADKLKSLSVEGTYRRSMGQMEMSGEMTVEMILPDKILKVETMRPFGDLEISRLEAINGETVWEDQQQTGGGGGMVMMRRGAGGGDPKQAQERLNALTRAEFARLTLGLMLATASFPVEFSYAGEAESPEGKADVLDVKGPNSFAARLFLDQKNHHPLMLTYKGKKPRAIMHSSNSSGPPSEADLEKRMKEAEAEMAQSPEVEFQVRFSDYKAEGGVTLPHKISKGVESETSEEIEFTKFKINPQIKPEKFVKK
jgi:hypothetical protein